MNERTETEETVGEQEAKQGPKTVGSFGLWMSVASLVVVLDQLTKWMIVKWVPLYDKIPVNDFINITHQRNTGAAFSMLSGASPWFFIILATAVSAYIVRWLWQIRSQSYVLLSAGLALVLGGAIGNVVDRVILGSVVDFIQVYLGSWPFPSFNLADSAITVGAVFLIIDAITGASDPDRV